MPESPGTASSASQIPKSHHEWRFSTSATNAPHQPQRPCFSDSRGLLTQYAQASNTKIENRLKTARRPIASPALDAMDDVALGMDVRRFERLLFPLSVSPISRL